MSQLQYPDDLIKSILRSVKTIAMVGASGNEMRPSYFAMKYLLAKGFVIHPINPDMAGKEILGQKVYASLKDVPAPVDMVDIFRGSDAAPAIVDEALAEKDRLGVKVIWMQLGVDQRGGGGQGARGGSHRRHGSLPQDRIRPAFRRDRLDGRQPQTDRQPQAAAVRQGRLAETAGRQTAPLEQSGLKADRILGEQRKSHFARGNFAAPS